MPSRVSVRRRPAAFSAGWRPTGQPARAPRRSSVRHTASRYLAQCSRKGRLRAALSLVGDRAAAGRGRVLLLVGAVARAYERAGEDRSEAERLALLPEPAELVGMHPPVDRRVLRARLEVLADRDHVDAVRP